jgi:methanethiol oxidase
MPPRPRRPRRLGAPGLRGHDRRRRQRQQPARRARLDLDPGSSSYGQIVNRVEMPNVGDELHHFGWNACSSALCPWMPHPHVERRYLVVPGLRSSRIYVYDTKKDPRQPQLMKVIEPEEIARKTGYSRAPAQSADHL